LSDLEVTRSDHVLTITLNRPHRKNAFTFEMLDEWARALRDANRDPDIRALILRGAGGSFCAGVDFDELNKVEESPLAHKRLLVERVHPIAIELEHLRKPMIASISGPAYGAGMDMSLLCDLRFADESARFCESYIKVGLLPGDGGSWLLPRIVGESTALRLLWTGDVLDAGEAQRLGIVEDVLPVGDLDGFVADFAQRLAEMPPLAIQMMKTTVRQGRTHDLPTALDLISSHMAVVMDTEESRNGRRAFSKLDRAGQGE